MRLKALSQRIYTVSENTYINADGQSNFSPPSPMSIMDEDGPPSIYGDLASEIVDAAYLEFSLRAEAYGDILARDSIFARYLAGKICATQAFNQLNTQGLLGTDDELIKIVIAGIRALTGDDK